WPGFLFADVGALRDFTGPPRPVVRKRPRIEPWMTPVEQALERGEDIYMVPAYPPSRNIWVLGPKGPDGRIIPLEYTAYQDPIVNVIDAQGNVTWRRKRPEDDVGPSDLWTVDRILAGNPFYKPTARRRKEPSDEGPSGRRGGAAAISLGRSARGA